MVHSVLSCARDSLSHSVGGFMFIMTTKEIKNYRLYVRPAVLLEEFQAK